MIGVNAIGIAEVEPSVYCMRGANDRHASSITEDKLRHAVIAHSRDMGDGFFFHCGLVDGRLVSILQLRSSVFESLWEGLTK